MPTYALATRADSRPIRMPGLTAHPLAVPSRGSTQLAVWALELAPGTDGQPHTVDREEVFVLHTGRVTATVGEATYSLTEGDALIVPPDTLFAIRNPGSVPARLTVCTSAGVRAHLEGQTITPPWSI